MGKSVSDVGGRIDDPAATTSGDAVLRLRGVGKRWPNGALAVKAVDLDLARGEFVTLVGPSGCGKSTILRIVAGLERETSGLVVRLEDRPGCVFQQPNLLAWRNLLRNVELYAELDGMPVKKRRELTREALDL